MPYVGLRQSLAVVYDAVGARLQSSIASSITGQAAVVISGLIFHPFAIMAGIGWLLYDIAHLEWSTLRHGARAGRLDDSAIESRARKFEFEPSLITGG